MEDLTLIEEPIGILENINSNRGLIWEKISEFKNQMAEFGGTVQHKAGESQSDEMSNICPIKEK